MLDLADEMRGGGESLGAPERVVQVRAVRLQLRAEAPVHHRAPARFPHEAVQRARRVDDDGSSATEQHFSKDDAERTHGDGSNRIRLDGEETQDRAYCGE